MDDEMSHPRLQDSRVRRLGMILSGHLSDCEFIVLVDDDAKEHFKCHKMILATASEVLERMLFGDFSDNTTVVIDDVSPAAFALFLKYVYTYNLTATEISTMHIRELFYMGYKYMIQDLIDTCVTILGSRKIWLLPDILPNYGMACIYNNLELNLLCNERIKENYRALMQHETLFQLNLSQLESLVTLLMKNPTTQILVILKALEAYGNHHNIRDNIKLRYIAELLDFHKFRLYPRPNSYLYS